MWSFGEPSGVFPSIEPNARWDSVQSQDPLERIKWREKIQEFITSKFTIRWEMVCAALRKRRNGVSSGKRDRECIRRLWRSWTSLWMYVDHEHTYKCMHVCIRRKMCVCVCAAGFLGQVSQQWLGQSGAKSLLNWHTSPQGVPPCVAAERERGGERERPRGSGYWVTEREINLSINQHHVI